jgi:hypothetical protein
MALNAKFFNDGIQVKAILLAFVKEINGNLTLLRIEIHLPHYRLGEGNLGLADLAIGLGDMPHDRKGCRKEGHLGTFMVITITQKTHIQRRHTFIQLMTQRGTQQRAKRAPGHKTKGSTQYLSPPTHEGLTSSLPAPNITLCTLTQ